MKKAKKSYSVTVDGILIHEAQTKKTIEKKFNGACLIALGKRKRIVCSEFDHSTNSDKVLHSVIS
jgi:hypothetical protein